MLKPGDVFELGRCRYEFVAWGCATGGEKCDNEKPVTVFEVDKNGERRWGMTQCVEGMGTE